MGSDALHAHGFCVALQQLPHDLLAERLAAYLIAAVHWTEHSSIQNAGHRSPRIDRHLHPRGHRDRPHAPVLPDKVHDAPPTIALPNVAHRQRAHLGTPESATE